MFTNTDIQSFLCWCKVDGLEKAQKCVDILFVTSNNQSCFPRIFSQFEELKKKKKLRKIRGKNWGKQDCFLGGLMPRTRFTSKLSNLVLKLFHYD